MLYKYKDKNLDGFCLWECQYSQIFNMDFVQNVTMTNPDDLAELLGHCLLAVETCLQRMTLEASTEFTEGQRSEEVTSCDQCGGHRSRSESEQHSGYHETTCSHRTGSSRLNNNCEGSKMLQPRILPAYNKAPPGDSDGRDKGGGRSRREARALHKVAPDGSMVRAEPPPCTHTISLPVSLSDVHQEVLQSGAVLYPACRDNRGASTVVVFCRHPAWQSAHFTSVQLAKLLLYYYTIPREECRHKGLTVIVDARGTTLPVLNSLLETLYTVEANHPGAVYIIHVLADRVAQSLLFRSPVFRPQVNLRIDLVNSLETLYKFVSPTSLPPELGGSLLHHHHSWVSFRMKLEPFMSSCRHAAERLVTIMQEMTTTETLPSSPAEALRLIEQHEQCVQNSLEDASVVELRNNGQNVLSSLSHHQRELAPNEDYRSSLEIAGRLYDQVQGTVSKLVDLAQKRYKKLEDCRQLRQFETQSAEVVTWLNTEGEEILNKFKVIADNLKGIRSQQKDFEKAYFTAITQLEKGNDLLEEANVLSQSENVSEVTSGVKDISKDLKTRIAQYTTRLDDMRERIDDTSQCYHLLDKSYEWALNAMKYAASVKTDKSTTPEDIKRLLDSLSVYREDNPPLPVDTFEMMLDLAKKLENDKLYEQCNVARTRCMETDQMLQERTSKLKHAKERLEKDRLKHSSTSIGVGEDMVDSCIGSSPGGVSSLTISQSDLSQSPVGSDLSGRGDLENDSSPTSPSGYTDRRSMPLAAFANRDTYISHMMSALRRRSYAGKPSAPLYSPGVAAFKDSVREMNLWEYEEYLFNEGLITEDMSDRIVASLPKSLSDSTMRGSRESLRGSMENLSAVSDSSPSTEQKGGSLPKDLSASIIQDYKMVGGSVPSPPSLNPNVNKHNRPPKKKTLRKAASYTADSGCSLEMLPSIRERRSNKSISMITGSNESLPCMPEEEEMEGCSTPTSHRVGRVHDLAGSSPNIITERKFGWSPVPVNTHLYKQHPGRPAFTQSHSMADLRVAEEDSKRMRTLSHILHEMIQTEQDYVKSLQFVIDNYLPELSRDDVPQTLRGKRSVIFGNIEKICEFHSRKFLSDLEKCTQNPYQMCRSFLDHDQEFFLYALYNKNKPKSDSLMSEYGMAFFRKKQIELGDRMDLNSYLLKPVQRMGKYALLLKQIIKECPETEPEYNDLVAALEMVKFQLRHGNDLLAMDCLKDCDVNLQEQGMLLRQDEFLVWQGRKKCLRHVFLFEEMVVLSKTKRTASGNDLYIYKNSIKTSDLGLTENVADIRHKFEIWFRKRNAHETYTLQAPTLDIKNAWIKEISMLLWKQAFRNRELRLSEAARMGIGRKPSMDLKPSKDNIHDRFVSGIPISHQPMPRMRNSIAVTSIDHLRNGSKRPHSLISVSSSSSSGSSNQSTSMMPCINVSAPPHDQLPSGHVFMRAGEISQVYSDNGRASLENRRRSRGEEDRNTPLYMMYSMEGGGDADLNCSSTSTEDACTQTTLKRPLKKQPVSEEPRQSVILRGGVIDSPLSTDV